MTNPTSNPSGGRITTDKLFACLSDKTRRRILTQFVQQNPDAESGFEPLDAKPDSVKIEQFRMRLHHNHLPKMETAGVIEWNRETGTIRPGPTFQEAQSLIKLLTENEDELPINWP